MDHLLKVEATETQNFYRFFKSRGGSFRDNKTEMFGYLYGRRSGKSTISEMMVRQMLEDNSAYVTIPAEWDAEGVSTRFSEYLKHLGDSVQDKPPIVVLDSYAEFSEKEDTMTNPNVNELCGESLLKLEAFELDYPETLSAEDEGDQSCDQTPTGSANVNLTLQTGDTLTVNGFPYIFDGVKVIPVGHVDRSPLRQAVITGDIVTSGYVRTTSSNACGLGEGIEPMPMISAGTPTISSAEAARALGLLSEHTHCGMVSGRITSGVSMGIVNGSTKPGYKPFGGRSLMDFVGRVETNEMPVIKPLMAGAGVTIRDDGTISVVSPITSINNKTGDVMLSYNDLTDRPANLVTEETLNSRLEAHAERMTNDLMAMVQRLFHPEK